MLSLCDENGVCLYEKGFLEKHLMLSIGISSNNNLDAENKVLSILRSNHMVCEFYEDGSTYYWLPMFVPSQPRKGVLKPRKKGYPIPPSNIVENLLRQVLDREPTKKELKQTSPATFGKSKGASFPKKKQLEVYNEWKNRQVRPNACIFSWPVQNIIIQTLSHITVEQAKGIIRFAYEAKHPNARFWRGDNKRGKKYLGLDNLFRKSRLAARVQMYEEWKSNNYGQVSVADDYGPLAKYRVGPKGTTSDFKERPDRLNAQQTKMVDLFLKRKQSGVSTTELADIALKYSARISELRGMGYDIAIVERRPSGINTYVMFGTPEGSVSCG